MVAKQNTVASGKQQQNQQHSNQGKLIFLYFYFAEVFEQITDLWEIL